jgi:hypothetical protein
VAKSPQSKTDSTSIITFNYDCALDYALSLANAEADYCLEPARPDRKATKLFKLHGSLNWAGAEQGQIVAVPLRVQHSDIRPVPGQSYPNHHKIRVTQSAIKQALAHAPKERVTPVIVPPTGSKGEYHRRLTNVWRAAADALADADVIVVAGYSLPVTDEFFRYLFALGTISPTRLKHVWVCDRDPTRALDGRFRALLGPMATNRYRLAKLTFTQVAQVLDSGGLKSLLDAVTQSTCSYESS